MSFSLLKLLFADSTNAFIITIFFFILVNIFDATVASKRNILQQTFWNIISSLYSARVFTGSNRLFCSKFGIMNYCYVIHFLVKVVTTDIFRILFCFVQLLFSSSSDIFWLFQRNLKMSKICFAPQKRGLKPKVISSNTIWNMCFRKWAS